MDNLRKSVGDTAQSMQRKFLGHHGDREQAHARGVLAELRRNVGRTMESDPLGLARVLLNLDPPLEQEPMGKEGAVTPSESAAYHALTLFAWHMQSAREPMHVPDRSFAAACGVLYRRTESDSFKPRFDAMVLAASSRSRLQRMREMIALLRGEALGFHYGQFAADLRALENPEYRKKVLMRWGRDFARIPADTPVTDS
ncbi:MULTISPECIES: type I-E CRISPR-associated protein Cse2/CasB [unclassified Corynebacterium]|uniref:type I-E CRISPR-associated protein Cse2/CasB n=1 Tax=unclassified Corynebacterium TaxID=2624378 RepID=UPI0029CA1782|nr:MULTISPECIES: type I-E CRISPR-associated protein Cse2/CasB [unclassified Corynebacterium]WPF66255.1 type I-E CRISPR-associated protein Cse2/CasB [Corynebacterium sp. 22KM0430]WPF68745.1 type I-E CRISPR-associated protein Cse2/CasB [Corynebacterium sp. 21KM1197]